jgi:large subunit ribosomal protein L20
MPRSTNAAASRRRRKKVVASAKGFWGNRSRLYRYAKDAIEHGLQYAYRDRRKKKTTMRQLWIVRINAACRNNDISYSRFISGLKAAGIELDRKSLSELAIHDADAFKALVEKARSAVSA